MMKRIPFIRSFHSSALRLEYSPNAKRLHSPLRCGTQKHDQAWAAFGCAEREAGVGAMRDKESSFLWMSDPCCLLG
ncbi:hypothetical protein M404DRAFT_991579 [Pisolithus tinctorius Marx 270]|uniref:Uncharacterized protein n=1 Tax=Pisolithus tinctorius Marx 270 TaxID=870435 RepID=A0A0C3PYS2_PISTI|nr:hypothetical protein M404DRAFT_991579 [Pisolithus tinctorius Marx 270]